MISTPEPPIAPDSGWENFEIPTLINPIWMDDERTDVPTVAPKLEFLDGKKYAYGMRFPGDMADWIIELQCYRLNAEYAEKQRAAGKPVQVLAAWQHFIHWALHFYGPGRPTQFIWHPWAVRMIKACCAHQYMGMAGSSSCGKSEYMGLWVIGNLLADYQHTLCLVTTQNLREAETRVWGSVRKYYDGMPPGIDGSILKYKQHPTPRVSVLRGGKWQNNAGIVLVPADASQNSAKTNKMQGVKAHKNRNAKSRCFLAGDEFTELSHALVDTLKSNLSNNDIFHAIAAANPSSKYDAFGLFVAPRHGWSSISVEDEWWEINVGGHAGVCLHFDALKNPNYLAKENLWPIQRFEKVEAQIAEAGGENTAKFWRNCRAFWPPQGVEDAGVFSEAEITQAAADKPFDKWAIGISKQRFAGVDTAFAEGGDRCVMMFAESGKQSQSHKDIIELTEFMELRGDTRSPRPVEYQVAERIKTLLKEKDIPAKNLAVDSTGAGSSFCAILQEVLGSKEFLRVQFGGSATGRPCSNADPTPANKKYANRVTELAFYAKELVRLRQLWGIRWHDLVSELTSRKHTTAKSSEGNTVIKLEDKRSYKKRTGKSPDIADAMAVVLDVVRTRMGTVAGAGSGPFMTEEFREEVKNLKLAQQRLVRDEPENPSSGPRPKFMRQKTFHPVMRRLTWG